MRWSMIVVGIIFLTMLMLFTLSNLLDGTAKVVMGALGLYGAIATLPLLLYLIIARPKTEDGTLVVARLAEDEHGTGNGRHERHHHGGGKGTKKEHTKDRLQKDKGPGKKHRKGKGEHVGVISESIEAIEIHFPMKQDVEWDDSSKGPGIAKGKLNKDGPAKREGRRAKVERKDAARKAEQKGPVCREECPRCSHLVLITESRRPCKTRCPKCNMLIVVK